MFDKLKRNLSKAGNNNAGSSSQQYAPPLGPPPPQRSVQSNAYQPPAQSNAYQPPPFAPPGVAQPSRQENALAALKRYDSVFLLDDSESMEMFWDQTRDALVGVVQEAVKYDSDGVDCFFFNNPTVLTNVVSKDQVLQLFNKVEPRRSTPTATALNRILAPYMANLEASKSNPGRPKPKPLNIICLTDGAPNRGEDPEELIVDCAKRLDAGRFPLNQLGIQFIQVGDDGEAREALQNLDDNMKNKHGCRDIVDTVPWQKGTVLDSAYIVKCLLGALNRKIDEQD